MLFVWIFVQLYQPNSPTTMSSNSSHNDLPIRYRFVAGATAGISETLLMYPLDVVKTRMQLQSKFNAKYTGPLDCFIKTLRTEGAARFYRGIASPILMEVPKRATKFSCNAKYQSLLKSAFGLDKINQPLTILSGAMAGMTEAVIITPFEVVKIRVQDYNTIFTNPAQCLTYIVKHEGVFSLYTGLGPTMWRSTVWNAGFFGIMHFVHSLMPETDNYVVQCRYNFIAGMFGGSLSCFLSVPFDVVKSQIQSKRVSVPAGPWYRRSAVSYVLRQYKAEGFRSMYKGITPIICRYAPGGGILSLVYNFACNVMAQQLELGRVY